MDLGNNESRTISKTNTFKYVVLFKEFEPRNASGGILEPIIVSVWFALRNLSREKI